MNLKLALTACILATPVLAGSPELPLTYEIFEAAVVHADLDTCPKQLAKDETFCRATMHHDEIHVFAFSENGDLPLVGFASFPIETLAANLN